MSKLSIIIPIYFNADTLSLLYEDIKEKILFQMPDYEIIMVDDGSQDQSWEGMKKIQTIDKNVKIVKLSRNFGSHAAILAGLAVCTGDCATIKTADLQEPSELILQMFQSWQQGNSVVLAVRSDRKESWSQKLFAEFYYWLVRKLAHPNMPQGGFDCYLIDRKVIEVIKLLDEKNSAITLQILWAGFKTDVIYYVRQKREIGKSRWTLAKKIKLVADTLFSFSTLPITFIGIVGALSFAGSLIWGVLVLMFRLMGMIEVSGWTTLFIFQLFSFGTIMLTLSLLGGYLWRTFDASRKRPVYIIEKDNTETIH